MNKPILVDLPSPDPGFSTGFLCTACGHKFRRKLHHIYVDRPTFEQRVIHKQETRYSEYIIPQRITCPKCQVVDQNKLTGYTLSMLSLTMTVAMLAGNLVEGHPVRIIKFALSDGRLIHPLDALELYRQHVMTVSLDQKARMRYANLLSTLGYFIEAEAEYTTLVRLHPSHLEGWYNLAAIYVALKHKREAKKALQNLVRQAQQTSALDRTEADFLQNTHHYLKGDWPLDELALQDIFEAAPFHLSFKRLIR